MKLTNYIRFFPNFGGRARPSVNIGDLVREEGLKTCNLSADLELVPPTGKPPIDPLEAPLALRNTFDLYPPTDCALYKHNLYMGYFHFYRIRRAIFALTVGRRADKNAC